MREEGFGRRQGDRCAKENPSVRYVKGEGSIESRFQRATQCRSTMTIVECTNKKME